MRVEQSSDPRSAAGIDKVSNLFTGSWIDENGSAPGVDLGTWIGEEEENRAWELLGQVRHLLGQSGAIPGETAASRALYAAEGSDWFWWFGQDQDAGNDEQFDDLFRTHLKNACIHFGVQPPAALGRHIVPHTAVWTFAQQTGRIQRSDRLAIGTHCPGVLTWRLDGGYFDTVELSLVGGVMAGVRSYRHILGPFPEGSHAIGFRFRCTHRGCDCRDICCRGDEHIVQIV